MIKLLNHIKLWNGWRKHNINSKFHKFMVLLGRQSPTFEVYKSNDYFQNFCIEYKATCSENLYYPETLNDLDVIKKILKGEKK